MVTGIHVVLIIFGIIISECIAISNIKIIKNIYSDFIKKHGRRFKTAEEENMRFEIFMNRLQRIGELNKAGDSVYGITKFADWTREERAQFLLSQKPIQQTSRLSLKPLNFTSVPESWDWRSLGFVTSVKDQSSCGGSWSFAATAVIESMYLINGLVIDGRSLDLSEQYLIDCDEQNSGCSGGFYDTAFNFVKAHGVTAESNYPYKALNGFCEAIIDGGYKVSEIVFVNKNPDEIAKFIAESGPVAVYFGITEDFFDYVSGVYNPSATDCSTNNVIGYQAVASVGFGAQGGIKYWILKNSWGSDWGDRGFFKMVRGTNACEIEEFPIGVNV